MGEPRYNGAFNPKDSDDDGTEAIRGNSFMDLLFPKVRPSRMGGGAVAGLAEPVDLNAAGRHNGAYQLSSDPLTEKLVDNTTGMHPITRFMASLYADPVAEEKKLYDDFQSKLKIIEDYRLTRALPMRGYERGYLKAHRPLVEAQNAHPASPSTWKYRLVALEAQKTT